MSNKKITSLIIFLSLFLPVLFLTQVIPVFADTTAGSTGQAVTGSTDDSTSGSAKLENPLGDVTDPRLVIGNVIRVILGLVGSLALAVFVHGGFNWVTSAGNEEKIKKGKDMITWASLGLGVVFLSYVLVRFIIEALTGSVG